MKKVHPMRTTASIRKNGALVIRKSNGASTKTKRIRAK